jgi:glucose uptake protein GlcU
MLLFLIGVIAVIAIIMGGIRYTTSNGDASQTKAAKDTILYAVVGLIVAIMAYAVVSWVIRVFV